MSSPGHSPPYELWSRLPSLGVRGARPRGRPALRRAGWNRDEDTRPNCRNGRSLRATAVIVADATALLRFPSRTTAQIATYRHGLRVDGACIKSLAKSPADRALYAPYFTKGDLELLWFPAMHMELDSEIVIDSPSGPSWMTPGPALIDLLSTGWQPSRVSFTIHANPIGTPANLDGPLVAQDDNGRC